MVGAGDHDQRGVAAPGDPVAGLGGVADGVLRGMAEVDAAGKRRFLGAVDDAGERLLADRRVDAGDEQALGAALGEKLEGAIDAGAAAGQHDDAFRLRVGGRRGGDDAVGEA